jgi:hemoglobin
LARCSETFLVLRIKGREASARPTRCPGPNLPFRNHLPVMSLLYERIGGRESLARLLRHFYADVRQDPLIGPTFNARIQDWSEHLAIIADFWETLLGATRAYSGPMPALHAPLGLGPEHFERWLFLWRANCRAHLPAEAAGEMVDLARHLAQKLQVILGVSPSSDAFVPLGGKLPASPRHSRP